MGATYTQGKVWGRTSVLLRTPLIELHWLEIEPLAYCSMHRHQARANAFVVMRGRLWVEVEQPSYGLVDVTELGPGMSTTVGAGLWHRFRTGAEPAEVLEIYYPEALGAGDIERRDVGGRVC